MRHRSKLNDDVKSIKVWLVFVSVALLINNSISDVVWASITTALLGLRSWDEFKQTVKQEVLKGE